MPRATEAIGRTLVRCLRQEHAQDMAEYGLLICMVAIAAMGVVALLGDNLAVYWDQIVARWPSP